MSQSQIRGSKPLHVVVLCHPDAESFNARVAQTYCETVREYGHDAMLRDLYRMRFDPVLRNEERPSKTPSTLSADVAAEVAILEQADVLVLIYPIWFGTPPAMMKGYVERVLGSGIGHRDIEAQKVHPFLSGTHLASITTSGNSWPWLEAQGVPQSLYYVFDRYLSTAFSMASNNSLHLGSIVEGLKQRFVEEELYRVTDFARTTCTLAQRLATKGAEGAKEGVEM